MPSSRTPTKRGASLHAPRFALQHIYPALPFGLFSGAFFTFMAGTMGPKFVLGLAQTDQTSPDREIPSWIIYLCVLLGSYLMCFRFLQVEIGMCHSPVGLNLYVASGIAKMGITELSIAVLPWLVTLLIFSLS